MYIDYSEFNECNNFIANINHSKLEDCTINIDGKNFKFPPEVIEWWSFIGLNNRDLLRMIDDETFDITIEVCDNTEEMNLIPKTFKLIPCDL